MLSQNIRNRKKHFSENLAKSMATLEEETKKLERIDFIYLDLSNKYDKLKEEKKELLIQLCKLNPTAVTDTTIKTLSNEHLSAFSMCLEKVLKITQAISEVEQQLSEYKRLKETQNSQLAIMTEKINRQLIKGGVSELLHPSQKNFFSQRVRQFSSTNTTSHFFKTVKEEDDDCELSKINSTRFPLTNSHQHSHTPYPW